MPDALAVLAGSAFAVACLLSPDHIEDGPVICPLRRLTGLPCPGCGLTRSWVYLVHGRWAESFAAHPFGPLALLLALGLVLSVATRRLRRQSPPDLEKLILSPPMALLGAAWIVFGVVRLGVAL